MNPHFLRQTCSNLSCNLDLSCKQLFQNVRLRKEKSKESLITAAAARRSFFFPYILGAHLTAMCLVLPFGKW